MSLAPRLSVLSCAYPQVSVGRRAELMQAHVDLPETFTLSTCLRLETVVSGGPEVLAGAPSVIAQGGRLLKDEEAAHHLFRVAAGLDSPLVGEFDVLTQFRKALSEQRDIDLRLARLLEQAVRVGREARRLLGDRPERSMGEVAARVVSGASDVVVFGAGEMAAAVVAALVAGSVPTTVVARDPSKVRIQGVDIVSMDTADALLTTAGAVVSCTSAKRRLISVDRLERALSNRSEPLLLVDMAMPPDFEVPPGFVVEYFDIDRLASMVERGSAVDDVACFVAESAESAFHRYIRSASVDTVIGELYRRSNSSVDEIVERFAGKLSEGADREILRQAVHTMARTLLAAPAKFLGEAGGQEAEVVASAFGIDG